ncbi:MAG: asparagine synthase (glutamine-hydrolyzing) [Lachnospiraceae bacterium]|nr:asparagine synthase (glutamine-hydrolyzing) [Lachnospiraceae bacterium]
MCGIVGLCNYKQDVKKNIESMKKRMFHRGPDSDGSYFDENVPLAFGHQRLAIVDITPSGAQPMFSHNGRYVIAFNGEIYNHRQLREEMLADEKLNMASTDFKGTSDTETLLEAFSAYGFKETLSKIKGMFAIALYDREEKVLYLTRDRIGEKPLYYGRVNDAFVFASDLGSISVIDGFDNKIRTDMLDLYFYNGYIPAPYCIYEDIYKLIPGTLLSIKAPFDKDSKIEVETYWDMKDVALKGQQNKFSGSFEEAVDELERLMKESIRGQMMADVPVGAFLSAGIDSSATVALMQSLNSKKVRSFTIGMEDPKYNEAVFAKEIARHIGTDHTELYITEQDAKDVIPKISHMFAEPFADSSQIPTYLVSKMTRDHVTVSLSGDGGDELFCGYTSYLSVERIWNKMRKIPYFIRKPVGAVIQHTPLTRKEVIRSKSALLQAASPTDLYYKSMITDANIGKIALNSDKNIVSPDMIPDNYTGEVKHDIMLMNMLMYHPDDILVKVDRTAMAVSLETRVPMLDKDVVEFAWTLPIEYLKDGTTGKRVLREMLYRYVPREMLDRPKKGFSIPVDKWLREDKELRAWAEELINPDLIEAQGFLNKSEVWRIWTDLIERKIWRPQIWYILMFQQWLKEEAVWRNK